MKHKKTIAQAVRRAQIIAQHDGLKVGDIVAHPSEPITCELLEVRGDMAVIGWGSVLREFPLRELFVPNVARDEAFKILAEKN